MRIAFCSHDGRNYMGGPYQWAVRIGQVWRDLGWEVIYLFLSDHREAESSTCAQVRALGFEAYVLPMQSLSNFNDHTQARVRWFYNHAVRLNADVFIANNLLPALYAARFLRSTGMVTVGVLHTPDPAVDWMYDIFIRQPRWQPSVMVSVARFLERRVREAHEGQVTATIACGTPMSPATAKFSKPFRVLYLGKLAEHAKQIFALTKVMIRATQELEQVEGFLVGDGPQKMEVLELLQQRDDHQVRYLGRWQADEVVDQLPRFHCLVLLSDFEGMPTVVTEAMAAGCVPLCYRHTDGIGEIVKHEYNGLLCEDRGDDFIRQLKRLSTDPSLWDKLSAEGRQFADRYYSLKAVGIQWEALLTAELDKVRQGTITPVPLQFNDLPPVHPSLVTEDVRKPDLIRFGLHSLRRLVRKLAGGKPAARRAIY